MSLVEPACVPQPLEYVPLSFENMVGVCDPRTEHLTQKDLKGAKRILDRVFVNLGEDAISLHLGTDIGWDIIQMAHHAPLYIQSLGEALGRRQLSAAHAVEGDPEHRIGLVTSTASHAAARWLRGVRVERPNRRTAARCNREGLRSPKNVRDPVKRVRDQLVSHALHGIVDSPAVLRGVELIHLPPIAAIRAKQDACLASAI